MGRVYRSRLKPSWTGRQLAASLALFTVGFAGAAPLVPARAADLPVGPSYYPAKPFPPPAIYDWTGIYVGGNVGGGLLSDSVGQNGTATTSTATNLSTSGSLHPAGVIGGGQIGANWEFAPWVVGIEGSWDASGIQGNTLINVASTAIAPPPVIAQERFTSNVNWIAAVTGRVGYAANDWLFYAKGGGAWMHVSYTEDLLTGASTNVPPGATAFTQVISDNRSGFTVGVGIEFGLVENISGKIEYDFYDFGSKNYNFGITPVSVNSNIHTLTVGINYKFNWSGGPKP
jgi:outer membrane immunogenic protein